MLACTHRGQIREGITFLRGFCVLKQLTSTYFGHSYAKRKVLTKGKCQDGDGRTKRDSSDRPRWGNVLHYDDAGRGKQIPKWLDGREHWTTARVGPAMFCYSAVLCWVAFASVSEPIIHFQASNWCLGFKFHLYFSKDVYCFYLDRLELLLVLEPLQLGRRHPPLFPWASALPHC